MLKSLQFGRLPFENANLFLNLRPIDVKQLPVLLMAANSGPKIFLNIDKQAILYWHYSQVINLIKCLRLPAFLTVYLLLNSSIHVKYGEKISKRRKKQIAFNFTFSITISAVPVWGWGGPSFHHSLETASIPMFAFLFRVFANLTLSISSLLQS